MSLQDKVANARVVYPVTNNDSVSSDGMLWCKLHGTYRQNNGEEPCWACEHKKVEDWEAEDEGK